MAEAEFPIYRDGQDVVIDVADISVPLRFDPACALAFLRAFMDLTFAVLHERLNEPDAEPVCMCEHPA